MTFQKTLTMSKFIDPQMTFDLDHVTRKLMQDDQWYLVTLMSKFHELGPYTS